MWTVRLIAALVALALGTVVLSDGASAQGSTVRLGRVTVGATAQASVPLQATNLTAPGLGAWEVNVTYDPDIVTLVSCTPPAGGICNAAFAPDAVRSVGATANGIVSNNFTLSTLVFSCDQVGATDLEIEIDVFVDATASEPQPIATKVSDGSITCSAGPVAGLGDVDCNGVVNSIDAALVLQYEARLITTLPCLENGDMSGDGRVNSIDAFLILVAVSQGT